MRRLIPLLPPLILIALVLFVLRELAFTDRILGRGDTLVYFYPYWTARDALLGAGALPLWTPDLFGGVPLLANPQVGALYPPNWLTVGQTAPDAVRVGVILHIIWAAVGAYVLGRVALRQSVPAALVTGAVFGLGGAVGAHTEQINQLQGLAWYGWAFALWHLALTAPSRRNLYTLLLGAVLALQFTAGHTQTVFICGVGLAAYALAAGRVRGLLRLAASGGIALTLASPQLVPTLELIAQSSRDGGLSTNEVLSFSLNPFIAARALLPSYDGKLFTEYIAYIGVTGMYLAVIGAATAPRPSNFPRRRAWVIVGIVALSLALGAYNPLNWLITRVPGFDLFRVPARWLALYGLAAAALAGDGLDALFSDRLRRRALIAASVTVLLLAGLTFLAVRVPADVYGPAAPGARTAIGWGIALAAFVGLRWAWRFLPVPHVSIASLVMLELAAASLVMPYNDLLPPDVWDNPRFTLAQLRAYTQTDENGLLPDSQLPPGRMLSISGLFFDPGDQSALSGRYARLGMTELEERYAFVAAKLRETASPNLPLAWSVPTIDGFGGGLLPTRNWVTFAERLYPTGRTVQTDGRLRENLSGESCRGACIPPLDALITADVEYLVVDKTYDLWIDGVNYDTTFAAAPSVWEAATPYTANAVGVVYRCLTEDPCGIASITTFPDSGTASEPSPANLTVTPLENDLFVATTPLPLERYQSVRPAAQEASRIDILAISLIDTRLTNQFVTLTPPGWERVLSSDIKLYRRTTPRQRAYIADATVSGSDLPPLDGGAVTFERYSPTHIEITATAPREGAALVLADSAYPGWHATVDGDRVALYKANVNFRAVPLPTGTSRVIFKYDPWWFPGVFWAGGAAWILVGILCIRLWRRP